MGYDYYIDGEILLKPKLSVKAANDLIDSCEYLDFREGGEEDTVGLVKGEITVIPGDSWTSVVFAAGEPTRVDHQELLADLQRVARWAKVEGCTAVAGALYCNGEDSPDLSRFLIGTDFKPREEHPTFVWPNGDKGWSNGRYAQ
jgi:hypothetical protein